MLRKIILLKQHIYGKKYTLSGNIILIQRHSIPIFLRQSDILLPEEQHLQNRKERNVNLFFNVD